MATGHIEISIVENSQSISGNYTNVTAYYYGVRDSGYAYSGYATYAWCVLNGEGETITVPSYNLSESNTRVLLGSITKNIYHNADGTKTVSASASWNPDNPYLSAMSGSTSKTLTNIPRYANLTEFTVNAVDETTVRVKWNADVVCDSVAYSINGSDWVYLLSTTFDIGNLSANTKHSVKIAIKRADSQLWTYSETLYATTYDYPKPTSVNDFTIGDGASVGMYNPLGRNYTLELISNNNKGVIGTYTGTYGGTINAEFKTTDAINKQYASIPNSQSGTYYAKVTYGSSVKTSGNATYSIKGTEKPTVGSISYEDTNETVKGITGNPQHIVQNQSNLKVTYTSATAKNSATIKSYSFELNGVTKTSTTTGGTVDFGKVNSANDLTLKMTVTDSRGLTSEATQTITMLEHSDPNAIVELKRLNNYEDETYLIVDASISSVDSKNTSEIKYRYKVLDGEYGAFITIEDRAKQTLSLDKNNAYTFNIVVTDAFGSTYNKEHPLGKGVFPLFIDTSKNSVGINCLPEHEKSFEIEGDFFLNKLKFVDLIYPVGAIYMSVNSTNPSSLFGGTWENWGAGRVPIGVDTSQTEFNAVEKTGGEKAHTLTVGEMPSHKHEGLRWLGENNRPISLNHGPQYPDGYQLHWTQGAMDNNNMRTINTGGSQPHNNLQPYITCYMWKRTA